MEIAIIGAGAATVCLLDALAQTTTPANGLTIYERSAHLWRGRPYQQDSSAIRVNAPPEEMSVRAGDPDHFPRWLGTRVGRGVVGTEPDPRSGARFVSRAVYGDYLEHAAQDAIAQLRARGWRVEIVNTAVTRARRARDRIQLRTADGARRTADYAVLCVGGDRPADEYGLETRSGFVRDPYPTTETLDDVGSDQRVAIIGSGLTAVDVVMALAARNHRGPITMVSRHGTLPAVRQPHVPYELKHFTPVRMRAWADQRRRVGLRELVDLMHAELVDAGEHPPDTFDEVLTVSTEDPLRRLRRHLDAVHAADRGLRILQRAVPDSGQDVWQVLSDGDRNQVMGVHLRTIMNLCCPMPPRNAAALLHLHDTGQLEVVPGLKSVEPGNRGGFALTADRDVDSDVAVNAVNAPAQRIPAGARSLVESLVRAGLAEHHPFGGLAIQRQTSRLTVGGQCDRRLFALGDITFGSLFFTFGIPVLVDRGVDIVHTLLADMHATIRTAPRPQPQRRHDDHATNGQPAALPSRH